MKQHDPCREWLESYRELKVEAARTSRLSKEPRGSGGDREKLLASLADADGEAMRKYAEAEQRMREIEEFIDRLPNRMGRIVLKLRYVDLMHWKDIHRELARLSLNYEEAQIYRFHGIGLREARTIWEEQHG